jgi:uncharacterized repeat protein (TIGR02543 family)
MRRGRKIKHRPAQTALEFVTTYGWAILIIAIVIALLAVYAGPRVNASKIPFQCNIQPGIPCTGATLLGYNASAGGLRYFISITNNLGVPIEFRAVPISISVFNIGSSGTSTHTGTCRPSILYAGGIAICNVTIPGSMEPSVGSDIRVNFNISYSICQNNVCTGNYIATGQSLQELSTANISFDTLTLDTSPTTGGNIYMQGVKYSNGDTILLNKGNYIVYASPDYGYTFTGWTVSGGTLSSNALEESTISLTGNAILTASFAKGAPSTIPIFTTISTVGTTTSLASSSSSTTLVSSSSTTLVSSSSTTLVSSSSTTLVSSSSTTLVSSSSTTLVSSSSTTLVSSSSTTLVSSSSTTITTTTTIACFCVA